MMMMMIATAAFLNPVVGLLIMSSCEVSGSDNKLWLVTLTDMRKVPDSNPARADMCIIMSHTHDKYMLCLAWDQVAVCDIFDDRMA